jgi:hypothetical protein
MLRSVYRFLFLALIVVTVATLIAPASIHAQSLPSGSYRQTCRDVRVNGSNLAASCRKIDGSWQLTYLDVSQCVGDISNENGTLSCPQQSAGPQRQNGTRYACIALSSLVPLHPFDGDSQGDFYAVISFGYDGEQQWTTQTHNSAYIGGWEMCGDLPPGEPVQIYLYDSDGSHSEDDMADISGASAYQGLLLYYQPIANTKSCYIRYDQDGGSVWWASVSRDYCRVQGSAAGTKRPAASISYVFWVP